MIFGIHILHAFMIKTNIDEMGANVPLLICLDFLEKYKPFVNIV